MKTVEELLKPRIKIINDWPGVAGIVVPGTIINVDDEFTDDMFWIGEEPFLIDKIRDYPYLFKELKWHEDRELSDMPKYIKIIDENVIAKVETHSIGIGFTFKETNDFTNDYMRRKVYSTNTIPSTEDEFNSNK